QNKLKALVAFGEVKTAEIQSMLSQEISRKIKDLSQMEKESRKLAAQKQKELQPLINKVRENIKQQQNEIRMLKKQLKATAEGIIFI
ncbi:MAG TPA: hypothetical protein VGM24_01025, partial [Puia sp.]